MLARDPSGTCMEPTADLSGLVQEHNIRVFNEKEEIEDIISSLIAERVIGDEPIFVVDIGRVKAVYEQWVEFLPNVVPHFAVKSNSDQVIIKTLALLGCNFDCASHGEISSVLEHASPERIVFAHPVKDCATLSYAREKDIDLLTFDSSCELLKIALYHPNAELLMRLRVDDTGSTCRFGEKFGATTDEILGLLELAQTLSLKIAGFSFHVGSGCKNVELYKKAVMACLEAMKLAGPTANIVDIGGGFSLDTFATFAAELHPFLQTIEGIKFIAEPGRLLVETCATLVVSVIGKKKIKVAEETQFVYHLNESVYGIFNNKIFDFKKIKLEPFNEREAPLFKSKCYGRTCDSIDCIQEECFLPDLAVGERLFVRQQGAYTTASSSSGFNGFELPKTVYVLTL